MALAHGVAPHGVHVPCTLACGAGLLVVYLMLGTGAKRAKASLAIAPGAGLGAHCHRAALAAGAVTLEVDLTALQGPKVPMPPLPSHFLHLTSCIGAGMGHGGG
eukprot:CAMPEP_0202898370 /NCGR_PEP_ID=MMETSP1392-20130828/6916_1 /ASSEMBLY_ACC=CAM_ASM_000868 /TAXON_ID=225041 /ORGANISM="Chlamydomonas chlamydogama, Strain SAG 11-48b" /LENGTH=103 /DNA_ID=CAMNT_0049584281 /DNA_START=389 /DNA_END=701 /DNA_ORIENTATION=-